MRVESITFHASRKVFRGIRWDLADLKSDVIKSGKVMLAQDRALLRTHILAVTHQTQKTQEGGIYCGFHLHLHPPDSGMY